MSYRNAGPCRSRNRTRHTWNDFKRNARLNERTRFFTAAPKHKRVAAFQAANAFAFPSLLDHEPLDTFLLEIFVPRFFTYVDNLRVTANFFEQPPVDEAIMEHNIGFAQTRQPSDGNQVRVTRPRSHDENSSGMLHRVFSWQAKSSIIFLKSLSAPSWSCRLSRPIKLESSRR